MGPGSSWHFPAPLRTNIVTADGQSGRVVQSRYSLDSWGDLGLERGGALLRATSSELGRELGLSQSPDLCGLLPLRDGMGKKKSQFTVSEGVSSST